MAITFDLKVVESSLTPHFIWFTRTQPENDDWVCSDAYCNDDAVNFVMTSQVFRR